MFHNPPTPPPAQEVKLDHLLQHEPEGRRADHDAVRRQQHEKVPIHHQVQYFRLAQHAPVHAPVLRRHLDEQQSHGKPEQGEEAMERRLRVQGILPVEFAELAREQAIAEPRA